MLEVYKLKLPAYPGNIMVLRDFKCEKEWLIEKEWLTVPNAREIVMHYFECAEPAE